MPTLIPPAPPGTVLFVARVRREARHFHLTISDQARFDALPRGRRGPEISVIDQLTGVVWLVRRAPCGARCYCAASARLPTTAAQITQAREG